MESFTIDTAGDEGLRQQLRAGKKRKTAPMKRANELARKERTLAGLIFGAGDDNDGETGRAVVEPGTKAPSDDEKDGDDFEEEEEEEEGGGGGGGGGTRKSTRLNPSPAAGSYAVDS